MLLLENIVLKIFQFNRKSEEKKIVQSIRIPNPIFAQAEYEQLLLKYIQTGHLVGLDLATLRPFSHRRHANNESINSI